MRLCLRLFGASCGRGAWFWVKIVHIRYTRKILIVLLFRWRFFYFIKSLAYFNTLMDLSGQLPWIFTNCGLNGVIRRIITWNRTSGFRCFLLFVNDFSLLSGFSKIISFSGRLTQSNSLEIASVNSSTSSGWPSSSISINKGDITSSKLVSNWVMSIC